MARREGKLTVMIMNREKQGTITGSFVELDAITLDGAAENLLSVGRMVEDAGYTFIATPSSKGGFTGFIKGRERLPVTYDHSRGLYWLYYVVGQSQQAIVQGIQRLEARGQRIEDMLQHHHTCMYTAAAAENSVLTAYSPTLSTRSCSSGDVVDVINYVDEHSEADNLMHTDEGDKDGVWVEDTRLFRENDAVIARGYRERKLTQQQRHEKCAHIGYSPNCKICRQTMPTRRVYEDGMPNTDSKPGRTWSADSIYIDIESYEGHNYAVVMHEEAVGYFKTFCMENRKHAGDHLAQAIDELRSDPMLRNSELVEVLKLDPAGEWHCQYDEFNDKMKARKVLVDTKITNIDKRQMAHGEGAVRIMELTAKRIMLSTRLEAEMWNYAIRHAALMRNLHVRVKDAARDGDGPRPLEALSNGFTSRAQCDRIRYYAQNPAPNRVNQRQQTINHNVARGIHRRDVREVQGAL